MSSAVASGCCSCAGYCVVLQSKFEDAEDAQGIIARGPEALQSQFSSGFGMVLNLLHTRSMEAARAFVQRSFDNYLGAPPPAAHAEHLLRKREAKEILCEGLQRP